MVHPAASAALPIRPLAPLSVIQEGSNSPALVLIAAAPLMLGVRTHAVQDRLAPAASAHIGADRLQPGDPRRVPAVVAVDEPATVAGGSLVLLLL